MLYGLATLASALVFANGVYAQQPSTKRPHRSPGVRLEAAPLAFEPNRGQTGSDIAYIAHATDSTVLIRKNGLTLSVLERPAHNKTSAHATVDNTTFELKGGSRETQITASDGLPGKINYLIGRNRSKWLTNLPTYRRVTYHNVYPGIDLVCYGAGRRFEYDFVVAAGADPGRIQMQVHGRCAARLHNGAVEVPGAGSTVSLHSPVIYQMVSGKRHKVDGAFQLAHNQVSFRLGAYDHSRPLVIDPVAYATCIGGASVDVANAIAVDSLGQAYITGYTSSGQFPTTPNAFKHGTETIPFFTAFVSKFSADGSTLLYSTFVGGNHQDCGYGIAVDSQYRAYVVGSTSSSNLPLTPNALQTTIQGSSSESFLLVLSSDGTMPVYYSYISGNDGIDAECVRLDDLGRVYVGGATYSTNMLVTPSAFQSTSGGGKDAFVSRFDPTPAGGFSLGYSSYLGGNNDEDGEAIAINDSGIVAIEGGTQSHNLPLKNPAQNTIPLGTHEFVAAFDTTKSGSASLVFSTFFSGADGAENAAVQQGGIGMDGAGNIYAGGVTSSTTLPVTPGVYQPASTGGADIFIVKYSPAGQMLACTYLGGKGFQELLDMTVDPIGDVYITGDTASTTYPLVNPTQTFHAGEPAIASVLDSNLQHLLFSTLFGINGFEFTYGIAVDNNAAIYIAGTANDPQFPGTPGAFQPAMAANGDAYVAKFGGVVPLPEPDSVRMGVNNVTAGLGNPFTITATMSDATNGHPIDGRQVQFLIDGISTGTATTVNGVATITRTITAPSMIGQHTITASFAGDAFFAAASAQSTLTVVNSQTTLTVTNVTGTLQSSVNLSATLTSVGMGVAGETVHFLIDGTDVGTATTNNSGGATLPYLLQDPLTAGSHKLVAQFQTDGVYNSATSNNGTLTVNLIKPTIQVNSFTAEYKEQITLKAFATPAGAGIAGHTVKFLFDGIAVGSVLTASDGSAKLNYTVGTGLALGPHNVTAAFAGSGDYASAAGSGTITVIAIITNLSVPNQSGKHGAIVHLQGQLTAGGAAVSGQTVKFYIDGNLTGSGTTASNGYAQYSYTIPTGLATGTHTIKAVYAGTSLYGSSTGSGTLTVTQ
jgi:hypothetical protein